MLRQIETSMQGRHEWRGLSGKQRERVVIEMEVEEVELLVVTFLPHALQQHHVQRIGVAHGTVEAKCPRP